MNYILIKNTGKKRKKEREEEEHTRQLMKQQQFEAQCGLITHVENKFSRGNILRAEGSYSVYIFFKPTFRLY